MKNTLRFGAYAVAGGIGLLAAGCVIGPHGELMPLIGPSVVVYDNGIPPPAMTVQVAPPPPQYEAPPPLMVGQVWAPGYWGRNGASWSWVGGRHIAARPGYAYNPGTWVVRSPGAYAYVPGFYRPANRPPPRMPYKVYRAGGVRVQAYTPR